VINALYILGYEVLERPRTGDSSEKSNDTYQKADLGFRRADENFDPSPMFT
jgi:hypothetical protein